MTSTERLADVTEFILDGTHGSPERTENGVPVLSAQNVNGGRLNYSTDRFTSEIEYRAFQRRLSIQPGDVLLTIVGTIGRSAIVKENQPVVFQRSVAVIRPKNGVLNSAYLRHVICSQDFQSQLARATNQSSQAGVYLGKLKELMIPLQPMEEQRRIAAILDQAETLRAKRRQALAKLDTLTQSLFLEMFGDPSQALVVWPQNGFLGLLEIPLRNGLSPSNLGTVSGRVLTLSAVTGKQFDASSAKSAFFARSAPPDQTVSKRDLLICRGNGNLNLVGKGHFPDHDMPTTLFPDTIIAARISRTMVDPLFIEFVWNSGIVRKQIERVARTTNGTQKVNQEMIESIRVPMPPLELQQEFGRKVQRLRSLRGKQSASSSNMQSVHASLQHRAFRGGL